MLQQKCTKISVFNTRKPLRTYRSILFRYDCPSWPPTAYRRSFKTATPTPQRRLLIGATSRHSLVCGSYFSTLDIASPLHQPPTTTSTCTTSPCVNHFVHLSPEWSLPPTPYHLLPSHPFPNSLPGFSIIIFF